MPCGKEAYENAWAAIDEFWSHFPKARAANLPIDMTDFNWFSYDGTVVYTMGQMIPEDVEANYLGWGRLGATTTYHTDELTLVRSHNGLTSYLLDNNKRQDDPLLKEKYNEVRRLTAW